VNAEAKEKIMKDAIDGGWTAEDALDSLVFLLDREREGIIAPKNRSSWVPWTPSIDKAVKVARRVLGRRRERNRPS
jgi:hypothetical protein